MAEPSTNRREKVTPAEPDRFAREVEMIGEIQSERSQHYGEKGRTFHRKQLLAARASFVVPAGLPQYAAQGLFANEKTYEAWIRLSSGSFNIQPDKTPDIRGFAIKVFGVEGPDARDGSPAASQDFLLIQQTPFGKTSMQFAEGEKANHEGALPTPEAVKKLASFQGFANTIFHTPVPIKVGPYAARTRLLPPANQAADLNAQNDLGADLLRRLPLTYEFQFHFFVDEERTPIEDATNDWPEEVSPFVTVARLVIPAQDPQDDFAARVEQTSFAPWNALEDHRPLGEVNRARRLVMDSSVESRGGCYR